MKTLRIMLDTSFLISFVDVSRPCHLHARNFVQYIVDQNYTMYISTIAISEFAVKDDPAPLINTGYFEIIEFNYLHACKAAELKKVAMDHSAGIRSEENKRAVIVNDSQIIGQAEQEQIDYILTEDENTMSKTLQMLKSRGLTQVNAILLRHGFDKKYFDPQLNLFS